MSDLATITLLDRLFGQVLCVHRPRLEIMLHVLGAGLISRRDQGDGQQGDYAVDSGIAVIPIQGILAKRAGDWLQLGTDYSAVALQIANAVRDPSVKGIILDIDSPGGESGGLLDLAEFIYRMRGAKPMVAVANDSMYSAAYALGSCADSVYVTQTGGVGSIGCLMLHLDRSGLDQQMGLKYTYVYSGDKKVEGNPHEPLAKGARAEMQAECDRIRGLFVNLVARNRNVNPKAIADTQAGCFYAERAVPLLADRVGYLKNAFYEMGQRLGTLAPGRFLSTIKPSMSELDVARAQVRRLLQ